MAKNMSLLWCSGSPPCWMVMIALAEKNLHGYHQKRLSLTNMAHRTPELMAINPRGQVPAFRHGERILNESLSACLYLENQFKEQGNKLIPSCPAEQAMMYQRMMEGTVLFQKSIAIIHHSSKVPKKEECDSAMGEIHEVLREEVKLWERYRKESTGPFMSGKTFSLSDVCVFPSIAFLFYYRLSPERYPKVAEYYNLLKERTSIKNTWPPHWQFNPTGRALMKAI
ncbi:glutathione S-transferase A-like [Syngnathus typhle]